MRRLTIRIGGAALLAAAIISAGCATPRLIRQAQDSFNAAARMETERRNAADDPTGALLGDVGSAAGYRQTLALLDDELANHREALRTDGLLGNALILKALCHWRLADLEDSADQRNKLSAALSAIASEPNLNLGTRDRVLAKALTGLRDHDIGLRATEFGGDRGAESFFCSAYNDLDRALEEEKPPASHSIRTYVELSKLAALREWVAAAARFLDRQPRLAKVSALQPCFFVTASELAKVDDDAIDQKVTAFSQAFGAGWPPGEPRDTAADGRACKQVIEQTCP